MFTSKWFTTSKKHLAGLLAFGVTLGVGQAAYAVGVASNTLVTNSVTVDYSVGGSSQPQLTDSVDFRVDNKVDLDVAAQATNTTVVPGQTARVLTYTIVNTGNTTQGYSLAASIGTNQFSVDPMNNVTIYVDTNANGVFDAGVDDVTAYTPGTNAGDLDPNGVLGVDDTLVVFVVADVPTAGGGTAPLNGELEDYDLLVTTLNAGTNVVTTDDAGSADDPLNVGGADVVFADSDGVLDGQMTDTATYEVVSAALVVSKTQDVTSDGFSAAGDEKAIPGATVRYTITLDNSTGTVAADNLVVVDALPGASVTYVTNSTIVDGVAINDGATVGNITVTITNVGANNETVTVNGSGFDVPAGDSWDITFDVTID